MEKQSKECFYLNGEHIGQKNREQNREQNLFQFLDQPFLNWLYRAQKKIKNQKSYIKCI